MPLPISNRPLSYQKPTPSSQSLSLAIFTCSRRGPEETDVCVGRCCQCHCHCHCVRARTGAALTPPLAPFFSFFNLPNPAGSFLYERACVFRALSSRLGLGDHTQYIGSGSDFWPGLARAGWLGGRSVRQRGKQPKRPHTHAHTHQAASCAYLKRRFWVKRVGGGQILVYSPARYPDTCSQPNLAETAPANQTAPSIVGVGASTFHFEP